MLSTLTELVISLILEDQSSLRNIDHDGNPVNLTGTATDVLHQQSDGTWRIVIDNSWGTV
jgi:ketosteroid isomerase-like protein